MTVVRSGRHVVIPPIIGVQTFAPRNVAAAPPANDWWDVSGKTCVAAWQPKGAASQAASYSNLANPGTYDAAPGTAPDWDTTTGWIAVANSYLTTGITPDVNYTLIVRFAGPSGSLIACSGAGNLDTGFAVGIGYGVFHTINGATVHANNWGENTAIICVAGKTGYVDGASIGSIAAGDPVVAGPMSLLGLNMAAPELYSSADIEIAAAAVYSDTLTAGEVAALTAAMAAL